MRGYGLTMLDGGASLRTGVGGVSDLLAVKCLHAHVAHALARPGYALGEAILARSGTPGATTARCAGLLAGRATARRAGVKVAIVDLGTNTCRLFLADVTGGRVAQDARVTTVVRLGQGVDRTGRLHRGRRGADARLPRRVRAAPRGLRPGAAPARRHERACATPPTAAQFLAGRRAYDFACPGAS